MSTTRRATFALRPVAIATFTHLIREAQISVFIGTSRGHAQNGFFGHGTSARRRISRAAAGVPGGAGRVTVAPPGRQVR